MSEKRRRKKIDWEKTIFLFVLVTLIISVIYSAVMLITAPEKAPAGDLYQKTKSDYLLMLTQCLLGVVVIFLPSLIERRLKIEVPSYMVIMYVVFLYCAIFLGEVRDFYYAVPHWDTILHIFSGAMLGALGFSVVEFLNKHLKDKVQLSPVFVVLFAFCFAVTVGVLWEIYEFTFDGLLGMNMQKFMLEDGTQLVGRAALSDTMKDLIVDALGALVICLVGYFQYKAQLKKIAKKENEEIL